MITIKTKEIIAILGAIPHTTRIERARHRIDIKRALDEYLKWGGYY